MIKVFVHGGLGELVGREWELDISTPREAFRAIEANTGILYKHLSDLEAKGVKYAIVADKTPLKSKDEMGLDMSSKNELHIIPGIKGAGKWFGLFDSDTDPTEGDYYRASMVFVGAGWGLTWASQQDWGMWDYELNVFGLFDVPVGAWSRNLTQLVGGLSMDLGMSLALQGVIKSLTKEPEHPNEPDKPTADSTTSFIFSNPTNNALQGAVVPVGYGRLRVGSNVVSSALLNCRLNKLDDVEVAESVRDGKNDSDVAQNVNMSQD